MATDFNNSFGDNTPPPKLYQRPKFAREVPIPSLGGILHFASCSSQQSVGDPVRRPPGNGPRNQRSLLDYSRARRCIHPLAGGVAGEANVLKQACLVTEEKPQLVGLAEKWARKTLDYLSSTDASYAARFNGSSGDTYSRNNVPQINQNVWNFLNLRSQTLMKILEELHD